MFRVSKRHLIAYATSFYLTLANAYATTSATSGLPWDTPLKTLRDSISGPIVLTFAILGIIGSAATLLWGGELSDFSRRMIMLVLALAVATGASSFLTTLFSTSMIL